jgi:tetratricopeptide (TPR) repeat protein
MDDRQLEGRTAEKFFAEAQEQLAQFKPEQAIETLEKAPQAVHRLLEFNYLLGVAQGMAGDSIPAVENLELVVSKRPEFAQAYFALALAYASLEVWEHVWQTAEKCFKKGKGFNAEEELSMHALLDQAKEEISRRARQVGLPVEAFRGPCFFNEKAQLLLAMGQYHRSIKQAEYAIRAAPGWASPRNNRALSLFFSGKIEAAIAEEQAVLETINAANIHALANLALFYTCLWQREEAAQYGERLRAAVKVPSLEGLDLTKAIEGLGIWEDDEGLWELAGRLIKEDPEVLPAESWHILGAAAANTGHAAEAKRLLERADMLAPNSQYWHQPALKAVKKASRTKSAPTGPCLDGRFPYIHFRQVWPEAIAKELFARHPSKDEAAFERTLEAHLSRYPFVGFAGRLMLWCEQEEALRGMGVRLLLAANHPEAYAQVHRFATSSYGSDQERINALKGLQEKGQLARGETVRFWSAKQGEWREIQLLSTQIKPVYEPPCDPLALKWVNKATQTLQQDREDPKIQARAIHYNQEALKIDPNCAIAIHNLGSIYAIQNKTDEAEAHFRRAVAADPDYLFPYTSLAELELGRDEYQACRNYLDRILHAESVPANAMVRALDIQIRLALYEGEQGQEHLEEARRALETLKSIAPDFPRIADLEELIGNAELDFRWQNRWLEDVHRYRKRLLEKPISATESAAACLGRISREALAGTLRFWKAPTAGRKAEVITRLVDILLDPGFLKWAIPKSLEQEEGQALRWVLEGGGIRSWREFTERYGDDFDESPYWQWHEPETIPGRLRMSGLAAVGTLDGKQVILIPSDLRPILDQIV